jgi:hypothetical protein
MKKILLSLIGCMALTSSVYAEEDKITKGFKTMDSLGCMILQECTDNVRQINSIKDIKDNYPNSDYSAIAVEFDKMLVSLNEIGVMVFLGDEKYFPVGHRGVYHTVSNNFYLNDSYMNEQSTLMSVMRHEGWHVAQDCMAGTIENSLIAIILPEESVPKLWREMVEETYPEHAVPWESEATWAGKTEGMTAKALQACAAGEMWNVYDPTPLTRKYLVEEGYMDK